MDSKYQSTAATAPQHHKQQQMSNLFTKLACKKRRTNGNSEATCEIKN